MYNPNYTIYRNANGLAAVFVSDLDRAVETAHIAFWGSDIPILKDWRLRECDYGLLNGASTEKVQGNRLSYLETPYPQGESWSGATDRVRRVLTDLPTRWAGQRVLIIGHVATRWALERFLKGNDLQDLASKEFVWQEGWEYFLS
jgi:broad specificity phosphatase PhoE